MRTLYDNARMCDEAPSADAHALPDGYPKPDR